MGWRYQASAWAIVVLLLLGLAAAAPLLCVAESNPAWAGVYNPGHNVGPAKPLSNSADLDDEASDDM